MNSKLKYIMLLLFLSTLVSCSSIMIKEMNKDFVTVKAGKFFIGDKPYYFLGTNIWYGCYIGSPGKTGDKDRLIKELDFLKNINVTNLRILAASEATPIENAVSPAIQFKPGEYDEELLEGLDFLLWEMAKRDMRGVLYLNNYWEWSGGMSQYNAWVTNEPMIDPTSSGRWHEFMQRSADFYNNEIGNNYFRKYIIYLVNRKNKFTGVLYKDDPTIMAWQLANEPRPGNANDDTVVIKRYIKWIDETAGFIKSLDKNHLVTTGNEGLAGSLQSEDVYISAHQSKNIDYITFHLWPKNWGWFDAKNSDLTFEPTITKSVEYLNKHIEYAKSLNKPITLEEFGLGRDNELYSEGTPVSCRDKFYTTIYKLIYDSASSGAPFAGSNFWAWGGTARNKNPDARWKQGDPFMGDPLQEPQGLNSVLHTDTTTIKIISEYADKMKILEVTDAKVTSK